MPSLHIVNNRDVVTWEPKGWPAGVVTGRFIGKPFKGYFVEHVVVFAKGLLPLMYRDCINHAKAIQLEWIEFFLPHEYEWKKEIEKLASRKGFIKVYENSNRAHWRLELKSVL